jgi:nucleotide-binding universal stress UspA family protein
MYRQILAAVDGSRASRLALDEAVKIAGASGASVLAACVVEHAPQLVDVGAVYQGDERASLAAIESATAALKEAEEVLRANSIDGVCRAVDAYGESIASVLARVADECGADLVVLGTHGRHGFRRVLLGSVAESLLRATRVPVLLVRHDAEGGKHTSAAL